MQLRLHAVWKVNFSYIVGLLGVIIIVLDDILTTCRTPLKSYTWLDPCIASSLINRNIYHLLSFSVHRKSPDCKRFIP